MEPRTIPRRRQMASFQHPDFDERLSAAAAARQAVLERFRAKAKSNDPEFLKKQAERLEIAEAREARVSARKAAKEAQEAAERDARYAARKARKIERLNSPFGKYGRR